MIGDSLKECFIFSFLGIMLFLETKIPLFPLKSDRWHHATQNIAIKFFNISTVYILFFIGKSIGFVQNFNSGLLTKLNLHFWSEAMIIFFICDFVMYVSHVIHHKISFLWRIHRVHHSDLSVDATTAYRTHIGETLISNILILFLVFPTFGVSLKSYFAYQIIFALITIFHHSNISMPKRLDDFLKIIIVTPNMHRLHHSNVNIETDSNYGSVFSFWDRLFKTYRVKDPKDVIYGLKEFKESKWQDFTGLLVMPFANPVKD